MTLYVGTIGQGIWRSGDDGETFQRASAGMFMEANVRALVAHPHDADLLYAGTDAGLYCTTNGGERWDRLETPFDPRQGWPAGVGIWSLLLHPQRPDTLFAGTCPSALYRSEDAGASWEKLNVELAEECPAIRYPRVTCLVADPTDADTLWAGIEIDGVRRSADGGETWQRRDIGLSSADIHALAVLPGSPKTLLASTNNDLNLSTDDGATWQPQNVKAGFPHAYCRGVLVKPDDHSTVFVGNGNGPPGSQGALQISHDAGKTWHAADLPVPPNSTIWTFAANSLRPDLIFAASVLGFLYRSEDGGKTWRKCRHEFGEVRALIVSG